MPDEKLPHDSYQHIDPATMNEYNKSRMDLRLVYDRLMRYTAMRARAMPEAADAIIITEADSGDVVPFLRLAFTTLADDTGALKNFDDSGINALTKYGMKDRAIIEIEEEDNEDFEPETLYVWYNLPGKWPADHISGMLEYLYEAVSNHALSSWFKQLGMRDISMEYSIFYDEYVQKIRNHGARFANTKVRRRSINL